MAAIEQDPLHGIGGTRFPGARKTGKQQGRGLLTKSSLPLFFGHMTQVSIRFLNLGDIVPVVMPFFSGRSIDDHTRTHRHVGDSIDHDERTRRPISSIAIKGNRPIQLNGATPDLIELEGRCLLSMKRVDVHLVTKLRNSPRHQIRRLFEKVLLARHQRVIGHPYHHCLKLLLQPW